MHHEGHGGHEERTTIQEQVLTFKQKFSSFVLFVCFVVVYSSLARPNTHGYNVSTAEFRVKPEPLFEPGSYFMPGQGFAKHLVAHIDPLVADFSNRLSHPT